MISGKSQHNEKKKIIIEGDGYDNTLKSICEDKMQHVINVTNVTNAKNVKPAKKINDSEIIIPTIQNYNVLTTYNYNVSQLKIFSKKYGIKVSGTKKELNTRLFAFLHLSSFAIKMQKAYRGYLQRKYNKIQGPGFKKRELCTNSTDFVTMDELIDLESQQFFSYKDDDGFIYGFDIASLYNLVLKNNVNKNNSIIVAKNNPYNRKNIPENIIENIKAFIVLSNILKTRVNLDIEDDTPNISKDKLIELRALTLFQEINALGNYSDASWFLSLTRSKIIKFIRELMDIWNYRLQLTVETKRQICPPNGDPFRNLNMHYVHVEPELINVKKIIIDVLEKLVYTGIDQYSKSLGAYYILGALTLVNETAATSLPWLFQSVNHF